MLEAAAHHFDETGYSSTSLAQVCGTAQMSVGAITFHFANKADLAEAVEQEGRQRAAAALEAIMTNGAPLRTVTELIVAFADLLKRDVMTRAALRLAHERSTADMLTEVWLPEVADLARRASADGQLYPEVSAQDVVDLAEYLARGAEARRRSAPNGSGNADRLAEVCELAFRGARRSRP
ncbi:TetR family transcriptional regulator [Streptomyces sp. 130]|uniref:TetR family transcriptional regulator n=1 Tax=Streptomyces sp. 130 TaxID=2591006 RepID=UPI00163D71A0|nr:TetR family transcriptional regulator [Streptomyces sp. 130]